ncbi:Regulator of G-protein signaling 22, partial [Tupaia chinensis]
EDSLATDDFLVDYFNEFLSLPTFPEAIRFNMDYGVFEIINDAPQLLEKQMKKILQNHQPRNPIYDVVRKGKNDVKPVSAPYEDEIININYNIMASYTQTKDWFTLAKQSQQTVSTFSLPCCILHNKVQSSVSESFIFDDGVHPRTRKGPSKSTKLFSEFEDEEDEGSVSLHDTPSQALLRLYLEKQQDVDESSTLYFSTCEEFLDSFVNFILVVAVQQITGEPFRESPGYINFTNVRQISFGDYCDSVICKNFLSKPVQITEERSEENLDQTSLSSQSESPGAETRADWCLSHRTYDIGNRKEFERFKKFIKGTLGERYLWLWMDIERLKVLKDRGRHQRAPRFCVTHSSSTKYASAELKFWHLRQEKPRKDIDPFPQMATLLPLRPKSCIPMIPEIQKEDFSLQQPPKSPKKSVRVKTATQKSWRSESLLPISPKDEVFEKGSKQESESNKVIRLTSFTDISECLKPDLDRRFTYTEESKVKTMSDVGALGGFAMENLLQSLYVENRAGFFFTKFCEHSGNKLWRNSVYFWFDLQAYHQLFYQEALQPFKVCKQAQFLFATYVAPSATLDIGLQQEKKKEIYMKMQPPFEDLFDTAEEYILLLLLEPWTEMVKSDRVAYGKVELVEETRQLDSAYFRKLQALHKDTFSKKAEVTTCEIGTYILPLPGISKETEYWSKVPEEYRQFNFYDLLNNKLEFEHFRQFLEAHAGSMDLMCWTDIEEFRRIAYRDRIQREAKSIYIKNKYLNKKYFFGPNSPASIHQQDQLIFYILYFGQPVESKWISSSCDIIAFRKALLNPVTARQFQRFVALKGDLLENGVLFWQEVQKYKDLCHSHCDESFIQKKITTIINCFINSSIPPALQIDIPVEQAQKIIEHRKELGPYVFREAQMTIFGVLFKYWPQFCEFRKNLTDEKIMSVLERRQEYNKQKKKLTVVEDEKFGKDGLKQYISATGSVTKTSALVSESFVGLQAYGRQPTWCYSKYIEALEQERILLKIQEELERKLFTGTASLTNFKPTSSVMSLKKNVSSNHSQSEFPVIVFLQFSSPGVRGSASSLVSYLERRGIKG